MKQIKFLAILLVISVNICAETHAATNTATNTATNITTSTASADPGETVTKTLVWPDGTRYVGGVADGKRSGKGTIFWQDGTRFVGQFENDMRNGPGTMILPDGTVYTGFFRNDELVDTETTIAASASAKNTPLGDDTVASLKEATSNMEADSIDPDPTDSRMEMTTTENEATAVARAAVEGAAVASEIHTIAPITPEPASSKSASPESSSPKSTRTQDRDAEDGVAGGAEKPGPIETAAINKVDNEVSESVKEELIAAVDHWAQAWAAKNVTEYLASYSSTFDVPGAQNRRTWEALRRSRIMRPRYINVDVSYNRFERISPDVVDVFFRQSYRSDTYSDLTDKVLRLGKEDSGWKILNETSR